MIHHYNKVPLKKWKLQTCPFSFAQVTLRIQPITQSNHYASSNLIRDPLATVFDQIFADNGRWEKGLKLEVERGTSEAPLRTTFSLSGRGQCNGGRRMMKHQHSLQSPQSTKFDRAKYRSIAISPSAPRWRRKRGDGVVVAQSNAMLSLLWELSQDPPPSTMETGRMQEHASYRHRSLA